MGRGIDRRIGAAHRLDDCDAKAVPGRHLAQQFGRAAAAIAERAVMADDDMAEPDRPEHDLLDKVSALLWANSNRNAGRTGARPRARDLALLDPKRVRRNGSPCGMKTLRGCGSKVRTPAGFPSPGRARRPPDQGGVSQMKPVEITHRQHRAARMGRSGTGMSNMRSTAR